MGPPGVVDPTTYSTMNGCYTTELYELSIVKMIQEVTLQYESQNTGEQDVAPW